MPFKYPDLRARITANAKPWVLVATLERPCLIWQGKLSSSGYPQITIRLRVRDPRTGHRKLRTALAHRLSLALARGVPVYRLNYVHHICRNPQCVEPSHLASMSQAANLRERVMKRA